MKIPTGISGDTSLLSEEIIQEDYLKENSLINLLPIAVYICDAAGIIRQYNEQAVKLWGRRPRPGDPDERFCGSFKLYYLDGTPLPHNQTPVAGCLADGLPRKNMEVVIERPDLSRIIVNINVVPIKNKAQEVTGMLNCFYEITEQKLTERALKESETEHRQLMQGLPAAVYTTDANGYVTLYNEAAVKLWGRAPEVGKELWCGSWKIYRPDGSDCPLDSCPMAIALKEKRPVIGEEIIVERPDGTRRHVAPHPRPIFDIDGNMVGAVNMLVDITDIKESEENLRQLTDILEKKVAERTKDLLHKNEELRKSEERYYRMIDEVEDYAIFMLNKEGIIQNWNKGAEKIKGYKEDEIVGKHFSIFYLPEDAEKDIPNKLLQQAKKYGKASSEGWRIRKNGTTLWASILITALHDVQGNIIGYSKVTRDLSERKMAEDKIKQNNIDLEFQNKELEQFAYAAAHDLKEPLRKIQFYSNYIFESIGKELPDKPKDYLNRSIKAAARMQGLIDDLLTYSKASSFSQQFEEVNLNSILDEVLLLHQATIEKNNAVIKKTPLPIIKGIPFQCTQLFDNLIGNALKYRHPHRPALITITAEKVRGADIGDNQVHRQKDFYKISIADNGIGFEPDHANTIFNLFQRLHSGADYSGSGIGLAICKKIVQNHKGFINASGESDQGAVFNIYLPG
jgi:PAS domain S-box-containing protein